MYCSKCGAELPDGAAFCSKCGNQLRVEKQEQAEAAPVKEKGQGVKPGKKKRNKTPIIAGVAVVAAAAVGIGAMVGFGVGPFERNGVYVLTEVSYPGMESVVTYTLDEKGNATRADYRFIGEDATGYDKTDFSCEQTFNDTGLLTALDGEDMFYMWRAGYLLSSAEKWSSEYVGKYVYSSVTLDSEGRPLHYERDYEPGYPEEFVENTTFNNNTFKYDYEYYSDGTIKAISKDSLSHDSRFDFDQYGRIVTKTYHITTADGGYSSNSECAISYNDSKPGQASSATVSWSREIDNYGVSETSNESHRLVFRYNDKGLVSAIARDGEDFLEYKYQYVSNPSAMVRINSSTPVRNVDL